MSVWWAWTIAAAVAAGTGDPHGEVAKPQPQKSGAVAPAPSGGAKLFCEDPFAALCLARGAVEERSREERRSAELRERLVKDTEAALARRLEAQGKPLPPRETLLQPPLFAEYLEELYAQMARQANFGDTVERITPSLLAAIESRVADPQARAKLASKISGQDPPPPGALRFITTAREVLALGGTDDFQRQCGLEGMAVNAYHESGGNYVVLCPGLLATLADTQLTERPLPPNFSLMAMAGGHEGGHALAPNVDPSLAGVYGPYLSCLRRQFPRELAGQGSDAEIISDFWAGETLARFLGSSPDANFANLRRAAGRLCDAEPAAEDREHLRPRARVGIILGRNPELMRRMNCPPTPQRPGCSLEGVVTL